MSHKKFGPDRFSRFDVYWIQTDKQSIYNIYRYMLTIACETALPNWLNFFKENYGYPEGSKGLKN